MSKYKIPVCKLKEKIDWRIFGSCLIIENVYSYFYLDICIFITFICFFSMYLSIRKKPDRLKKDSSLFWNYSVQLLSRVWLCDPMDCCSPGLSVHHQLLESTQTHVHWVGDAIQPSHPLSSPSPPALNLSQHQGLFKWVSSSHQMAKVLEFQL